MSRQQEGRREPERADIQALSGSLARLRDLHLPAADRRVLELLSPVERAQLGQPTGEGSRFVTEREWRELRPFLVARDSSRRPGLDPELAAYTPGETLNLLQHPEVKSWHRAMARFDVPEECKIVALVPCAATKPWEGATRGIYASYNALRAEVEAGKLPKIFFVTVSEPLGVVPETRWGSFPPYENPGLFRDNAQRSGLMASEWKALFGNRLIVPFDKQAYDTAVASLAKVIAAFARRNEGEDRVFVSFVENLKGQGLGSHSDMLDKAGEIIDFIAPEHRFQKREAPRKPPLDYVRAKLQAVAKEYKIS